MQHDLALFELLPATQSPQPVTQSLRKCHQATTQIPPGLTGKVRVRGKCAYRIPGGEMKMVAATWVPD